MRSPDPSIDAVVARAPASCGLRDERSRDPYLEARRAMEICNACRYCEGFCAVFPAMTRRRSFEDRDLDYLANLCHGCRGCYYSCQYAPPHEFGINVPRMFADVRLRSYERYSWPAPLGRLFRRNGTVVSVAAALGIALALILAAALIDPAVLTRPAVAPGDFYAIVPHSVMVSLAGSAFLFALVALAISAIRFWRDITGNARVSRAAFMQGFRDALTLRNLGAHGDRGCNDRDERYSNLRRRFHHALFYGFLMCFGSTSVASIYAYVFGWQAPYPFWSLPVQLGSWGGVGILVGAAGLAWVKGSGDSSPTSPASNASDRSLLILLALASLTGLLLLALRTTTWVGVLLAIHLGVIIAFFLMIPYSKMVHGVYRSAALVYSAMEQRRDSSM
jgi:citrate/tricarballylate utilization protein